MLDKEIGQNSNSLICWICTARGSGFDDSFGEMGKEGLRIWAMESDWMKNFAFLYPFITVSPWTNFLSLWASASLPMACLLRGLNKKLWKI